MSLVYNDRNSRQIFIANYFKENLCGSVLNVGGGGNRSLGKLISASKYSEIDISGNPDYKLNLELDHPIPIGDKSYDTVICTDVLEHLDEFHRVFSELIRISNDSIIISLPNGLRVFYRYLLRKKYLSKGSCAGNNFGIYAKYYGLPNEKPEDRHKWFFSYTDSMNFIKNNAQKYGYVVVDEFPIWSVNTKLPQVVQNCSSKFFSKSDIMMDLFAETYWCLLKKINRT